MSKGKASARRPATLVQLSGSLGAERDAILQGVAALQLVPANATKAIRFERLLEAASAAGPAHVQRPVTRSRLRRLLTTPPVASRHVVSGEDPFEETFTAEISFHGGSHNVVQGGVAGAAAGCHLVLSAVNGLRAGPEGDYAKGVIADAIVLLILSDRMCSRAELGRWVAPTFSPGAALVVPEAIDLNRLVSAATFSEDDLARLFGALSSHVAELVAPGSLGIEDHESDGPTDDRVYLYPLVRLLTGDTVVALPGGIATSITHRALSRAVELACVSPVWDALHKAVHRAAASSLRRLAWRPRAVPPGLGHPELFRESFYSFDDDKLAHVVSVVDPLDDYRAGHPCDPVDLTEIQEALHERFPLVNSALRAEVPGASVLHLVCHAPLGLSSSLGFRDEAIHHDSAVLYLGSDDLDIISRAEAPDPLALWKFALATWRLHGATHVIAMSTLDEYAIYKKHGNGFYMSDEALPNLMVMSPGSAGPLRVKERQRVDQHLVRVPDTNDFVEVARWDADDRTPIYQPQQAGLRDYHLVELRGPCWVVPSGGTPTTLKASAQLAQAVAFWLWRARELFDEVLGDIVAVYGHLVIEVSFELPSGASNASPTIEPVSAWLTCEGAPATGRVRLVLSEHAGARLQGPANDGERAIAASIVVAIHEAAGHNTSGVYESTFAVLPGGLTKMMHVFDETDDVLLSFGPTRRPRLLQDADLERLLDEIGEIVRNELGLSSGPIPSGNSTRVLNDIVAWLFDRLIDLIASLDPTGLLEELLAEQEGILYHGAKTSLILPCQAACFGADSLAVIETIASERQVTSTAIANRFLIECATATPPSGGRPMSLALYDEALAIAKQIVEFGMLSDAIFHRLSTATLAVLPSGRLGVSRDEPYHETLEGYVSLLADRALPAARQSYSGHWAEDPGANWAYDPSELNVAFAAEFGVTAQELSELSGELMRVGAESSGGVASRDRQELVAELSARLGRDEDAIIRALDVFSLGPLDRFPPRTNPAEVFPGVSPVVGRWPVGRCSCVQRRTASLSASSGLALSWRRRTICSVRSTRRGFTPGPMR